MYIIITNYLFISELVDTTTGLTGQVLGLEQDLVGLDDRVADLEAGEGGSANVTGTYYKFGSLSTPTSCGNFFFLNLFSDLNERVDALELVTSQLSEATATQDGRISTTEDDVAGLDTRVNNLESVNITGTST